MATETAQPSQSGSADNATVAAAEIQATAMRDQAEANRYQGKMAVRAAKWTAALALAGSALTGIFQFAGQADDRPQSNAPQTSYSAPVNPVDTARAIDYYDQLQREGKITPEQAQRLKADAIDDQVNDVAARVANPVVPG